MSYWDGTRWTSAESEPTEVVGARPPQARLSIALLLAALVALPAAQALAGSGTSRVWVETAAGAGLAAASISYGSPFVVGYQTRERQPWAHVVCYANESTVYSRTYPDGSVWGTYFSVYPGGPQPQDFVAGQSVDGNWAGGGASCRVDLLKFSADYSRATVLATSTFTVSG